MPWKWRAESARGKPSVAPAVASQPHSWLVSALLPATRRSQDASCVFVARDRHGARLHICTRGRSTVCCHCCLKLSLLQLYFPECWRDKLCNVTYPRAIAAAGSVAQDHACAMQAAADADAAARYAADVPFSSTQSLALATCSCLPSVAA